MNKPILSPASAGMTFTAPPGMVFSGQVVYTTSGAVVPVYDCAPAGELDINTAEGWNAIARKLGGVQYEQRPVE